MKMIMRYQKTKITAKGSKVYFGEDALPYVENGKILAVADGLGGRGGYPHTKVNLDILEKDKLYDVFFKGVFVDAVKEDADFMEHIYKSFNELFLTASYFTESYDTYRTSGYYASRLVSIISLYLLKYEEEFNVDALFERVNAIDSLEEKNAHINEFTAKLAQSLKEKLTLAASNANLERESRISGAYLLPSTLTIALVQEKESSLDVIYLWAGDTRGYYWSESEGLMQITEDHEKHETMTNLITLTKEFKIEGAFVGDLPKPCILFNSSDGCYKCPVFASPFDLEYIFIDSIASNNDFEGASNALAGIFKAIGTHDDSNTMALSAYGYEDYKAVKTAALNRKNHIHETIVKQLEGILTIDYPGERTKAERALNEVLATCDKVLTVAEIKELVLDKMIEQGYDPFLCTFEKRISEKGETFAKHINSDNLPTKELAKVFYSLELEELKKEIRTPIAKLKKLIKENLSEGVCFEVFLPFINVKTKNDKFNAAIENKIYYAINSNIIAYTGTAFKYKNISAEIPEDYKEEFKTVMTVLTAIKAKQKLSSDTKALAKSFVNEYYLANAKQFASQLYPAFGEQLKACDEQLSCAIAKFEEMDAGLTKRNQLYAEYYENYKKRYVESILLKD